MILETPELQAAAAIGLVVAGWRAARRMARWPAPYWFLSYVAGVSAILLIGATRRFPWLGELPVLDALTEGRTEFALLGLALPPAFLVPAARLPREREKKLLALLGLILLGVYCVLPFLQPVTSRSTLDALVTSIDRNGVCLQGTVYTCGPAAAVTLMRRLGQPAEEGDLARAMYTGPIIGTPPDMLSHGLNRRYGARGFRARWRWIDDLDGLARAGPAIAVVKYKFLIDHYVTVMEITPEHVVVGDPLKGLKRYTHPRFLDLWRRVAVIVEAPSTGGGES